MGEFLEDEVKKINEGEATYALREGWHQLYQEYPTVNSLALLWAQFALETGRGKAIHCYNFGNLKRSSGDPTDWTMFRCSEIINGREVFFDPPHPQTHFRAYKTAVEGATDYIRFLSQRKRYLKAWEQVKLGDPAKFSHELKVAGYYTAGEAGYTASVVKLTNEFKSKAATLLEWKPPVEPVAVIPVKVVDTTLVMIPDPDLRSGPAESELVPLQNSKNIFMIIIEFLLKLLGRK